MSHSIVLDVSKLLVLMVIPFCVVALALMVMVTLRALKS